jgi:N-acetylglucosaminyldiphosphoundecaprenol N-acetyl-beta-D-mannosaminyltransferase
LKETFEKTTILGVKIDLVSMDELIQYVIGKVQSQRKTIITYLNVHAINLAFEQGWFRNFINHSELVFCDGYGVKWAAHILTGKILQRFTPPDWFDHLACECADNGISMFLLGTRQEVIEKFAVILNEKYPRLKIVGIQNGYFNKDQMSLDNQQVLNKINNARPDILIVGFGMPTQEKWILENWDYLQTTVVIPVGAMFDYLAGEVYRAPLWMTDNGLEWLGRLFIEPLFFWRIFLHQILGFPMPS